MFDAVSGRTRTWPYGTRKTVKVFSVDFTKSRKARTIICVDEAAKEGYVLIEANEGEPPKEGTVRVIAFTAGGPTGGYWKIDPMQ